MNPILALLLLGGGLYAYSKYKAGKGLQFYPSGLRFENKTLYFVLDVTNPSFTDLQLNSLFAQVFDKETEVGRTHITTPVTIKKNGTTSISLPIKFNIASAIFTTYKIIKGEITSLKVKGTFNSEGVNVPFEEDLPISIV